MLGIKFWSIKLRSFSSPSVTVLLSAHNICFGWEIRKILFDYKLLSSCLRPFVCGQAVDFCSGSFEPSLLTYGLSTKISWTGLYTYFTLFCHWKGLTKKLTETLQILTQHLTERLPMSNTISHRDVSNQHHSKFFDEKWKVLTYVFFGQINARISSFNKILTPTNHPITYRTATASTSAYAINSFW